MFHYPRLMTVVSLLTLAPFVHACANDQQKPPPPPPPPKEQPAEPNTPPTPNTPPASDQSMDMKKLSQAFGNFIGRNLKNPGPKFDLESIIVGMRKGYAGEPSNIPEDEYQEQMRRYEELAFEAVADKNMNDANTYLQNKVQSLPQVVEVEPNKLYYSVEEQGDFDTTGATEEGTPSVRYKGMFSDGTVFGSSEDTGGTVLLSLKQTIPGFRQGVVGMKKGEKRKIWVHPDLGYGTSGQLPPNQLLIFEIEMVDPDARPQFTYNPATQKIEPTAKVNNNNDETPMIDLDDDDEEFDQQLEGTPMSDEGLGDEDFDDQPLQGEKMSDQGLGENRL